MSFSSVIKDELCRVEPQNECCARAELACAYHINFVAGAPQDCLVTENAAFARRVYNLLRRLKTAPPDIIVRKNTKLKKNATYTVRINAQAGAGAEVQAGAQAGAQAETRPQAGAQAETQAQAGAQTEPQPQTGAQAGAQVGAQLPPQPQTGAQPQADGIDSLRKLIRKKCCKKAALRGAFLAGGSVSDPEKLYHLEIYCKKYELARYFSSLMSEFGLNPKITERTDYCVTYVKDSERIVDFLNLTGAHRALLSLENTRIIKDMRNSVNRAVNCETANLEKTVNASLRQITSIIYIKATIGFDALPENLREIAELREANREISLKELGQLLSPPLGKSGVNHRLRKLDMLAADIRERSAGGTTQKTARIPQSKGS